MEMDVHLCESTRRHALSHGTVTTLISFSHFFLPLLSTCGRVQYYHYYFLLYSSPPLLLSIQWIQSLLLLNIGGFQIHSALKAVKKCKLREFVCLNDFFNFFERSSSKKPWGVNNFFKGWFLFSSWYMVFFNFYLISWA